MIELRRRHNKVADTPSCSRLPKGYQEVEYLYNTGMQCIKLPIVHGFSGDIKVKMSVHANYGGTYSIIAGWNDGPQIALKNSGGSLYWHNYNTTSIAVSLDVIYNTRLEINVSESRLYVNEKFVVYNSIFNNFSPLGLFNFTDKSGNSFVGRIYEVEINGTSNLHLIPCYRISDRVAGMYDIVNDVFYTNAGTGEFLVGQDVQNEIQQFTPQFIENSIVETDIVLSYNYEYEIRFSFDNYYNNGNGSGLLFGLNSSHYRLFHNVGSLYYDINGASARISYVLPENLKNEYFICRVNNFNMYIDDVLVKSGNIYTGTLSQDGKYLKLFMNTNDAQYSQYAFRGYFDYLKIYDKDGVLIHELRMTDTKEVWDVVTNKVYPCINLLA